MLSRDEADRIATAIQVVRPEWNHAQIMGVLAKDDIRIRRTYHDTFHAALAIALDPDTRQPTRLLEPGAWWNARPDKTPTGIQIEPIDYATACARCLKPFGHLWHGNTGTPNDCVYLDPNEHKQAVNEYRTTKEQHA